MVSFRGASGFIPTFPTKHQQDYCASVGLDQRKRPIPACPLAFPLRRQIDVAGNCPGFVPEPSKMPFAILLGSQHLSNPKYKGFQCSMCPGRSQHSGCFDRTLPSEGRVLRENRMAWGQSHDILRADVIRRPHKLETDKEPEVESQPSELQSVRPCPLEKQALVASCVMCKGRHPVREQCVCLTKGSPNSWASGRVFPRRSPIWRSYVKQVMDSDKLCETSHIAISTSYVERGSVAWICSAS